MCLSVARCRSFSLGVCRGGGCHGVDITGQYSSENWLEFGVVKSTGKQGRRGKKKKARKERSRNAFPRDLKPLPWYASKCNCCSL